MKKLAALLLSALFLLPLTACRTKETASRAETVQERYAALTSYTAAAAVELADEEENVHYTLRFDADAEETKVTVLAPAGRRTSPPIRSSSNTTALCSTRAGRREASAP